MIPFQGIYPIFNPHSQGVALCFNIFLLRRNILINCGKISWRLCEINNFSFNKTFIHGLSVEAGSREILLNIVRINSNNHIYLTG
jgi:hypothetical protein